MSKTVRAIVAVGTLLVALFMLGISIFLTTINQWGPAGAALALAAVISIFVYHDAKFFFFNKENK